MNHHQDTALLLIDLQPDFMPGGALAIPGGDEIIPLINRLAQSFPHVILTQDWHPPRHISFASTHAKSPSDIITAPYGRQIIASSIPPPPPFTPPSASLTQSSSSAKASART